MHLPKKIISTFFHNPMPEDVQQRFGQWCLAPEDTAVKEDVLRELWETLDPATVLNVDDEGYRLRLQRLHREIARPARRRLLWRAVAAAAVLLLVAGIEYVVVRQFAVEDTVCLITADNSKGQFTLPDGSVVWLNAESQLSYPARFGRMSQRRVKLVGEAFFDVQRDTLHPFIVDMDDIRVRVLGTRFNACCIPVFKTKEIALQSGSVEITGPRIGTPVRLEPNQYFIYDLESGRMTVRNRAAGNYCSWLNTTVDFNNTRLADILIDIEHRYNVRFEIDDSVDTNLRLSFRLYPETLEETLHIVSNLAHVRFNQINKYYISMYK